MSVIDEIKKIAEDICDHYCKYPDIYLSQHKDPDDATDKMFEERCNNCPLLKLS